MILKFRHKYSILILVMFVSCLIFLQSCRKINTGYKPSIEENINWKIEKECGYKNCYPKVDVLSSNEIKIRIEAFDKKEYLLVRIIFLSLTRQSRFNLNPSKVAMRLGNKKNIKAKGFSCAYTIWDIQHLRKSPPVDQLTLIDEHECFLFFFDIFPPSIEEGFSLDINGLLKDNISLNVPNIHFRGH